MGASCRRILVFGGTFDPPHLAHVRLPALAARELRCDEILYVPARLNPLKTDHAPTSKDHRLAMLALAVADVPNAKICTLELDRPGPSYTVDTLVALKHELGEETELRLLIGADQAREFHRWKDWRQILTLAAPAVMLREPWDRDSFLKEMRERYSEREAAQWMRWILPLPRMRMCATTIRERLASGERLDGLLPPAVVQYIRQNDLYCQEIPS